MRIWSIQSKDSFPMVYFAVVGAVFFAVAAGVLLLVKKWRR